MPEEPILLYADPHRLSQVFANLLSNASKFSDSGAPIRMTVRRDGDAIEAQAFGFLAARGMKGLPLSYPATTGVPIPMTGGLIARP